MDLHVSILATLLIVLTLFGKPRLSKAKLKSEDLEITLIAPPVIVNAVSFPVVARVVNNRPSGDILLKKADWKWEKRENVQKLKEKIEAGGNARKTLKELKKNKSLSAVEQNELKNQYEKLKKAITYLRFTVTGDMAREVQRKGSIRLALKLTGESLAEQREVSVIREVTLKAGRKPQKPSVAPGTHRGDCYFGDTHSHSTYTWDYYFGNGIYTIPELKSLGMVAGLQWLVLTDHSYCLDAAEYNEQKNTVTSLSDSTFAFLYGEELSCAELVNGVKAYNTCHYNGILNSTFVPCETDIFRKASSPDSQQGIDYIKQYGGLAIINHPSHGTSILEAWNFNINSYPYTHGETGMEILNGGWNDTNNGSTTRWIDQRLLKGEKVFPFAGSDTESSNHFGECYTVVYADTLTQTNIKENLAAGHHYVTTYPGLAMWARKSGDTTWSWMGDTVTMGSGNAEIYVSYSDGYDGLDLYVMKGKSGWSREQQVYSTSVAAGIGSFTINVAVEPGCYLRIYCKEKNDRNYRAYTTPIWFN